MSSRADTKGRFAAMALAASLLLGGFAGGVAVERMWLGESTPTHSRRGPPRDLDDAVERYSQALDLSDAQVREVRTVIERERKEMGELFRRMDPEMEEHRRRSMAEIEAILEPGQLARFEEMKERFEQRRARMRERHSLQLER